MNKPARLSVVFTTRHRSSEMSTIFEPTDFDAAPVRWRFLVGRGHTIQTIDVHDDDPGRPVASIVMDRSPEGFPIQVVQVGLATVAQTSNLQDSLRVVALLVLARRLQAAHAKVELVSLRDERTSRYDFRVDVTISRLNDDGRVDDLLHPAYRCNGTGETRHAFPVKAWTYPGELADLAAAV